MYNGNMKYKMRDRIQFEYKGQLWTGTIISAPLSAKSSQTYVVSLDNYMSYQIDGSQIKGIAVPEYQKSP